MRTHKHAFISLGYAGGVAFFSGRGLADPYLYLFAFIGGEIIDFIDHPLYQFVYRRNEPHVVHARRLFFTQGIRQAMDYLKRVEAKRELKGLALHNAFFLLAVSCVGILSSLFLPSPSYLFIFSGAFILHMLMDIIGDFWILGHVNNWLWVIPLRWIKALGERADLSKISARICFYVLPWLWLPVIAFILVSVRAGWQLANPAFHSGLYVEAKSATPIWIVGFSLLLLIFYALWLLLTCFAAVRKYSLERRHRVTFSLGSLSFLWSYLRGAIPRTRSNAERVYLRVEADGAVWTILSTTLIALVLLSMTWLHWKSELLFFLTPIFFALIFGILIHSTVGELAGGFGVILAWTSNTLLSRLYLQEFWPLRRGFLLFLAAVVAWTVGVLGAVFLRGVIRMSVVGFVFEFSSHGANPPRHTTLSEISSALENGYRKAHETLIGNPRHGFLWADPPSLLLEPYTDIPIWGTSPLHFQASDSYCPMIRETAYALCANALMNSNSARVSRLLPVMPRRRIKDGDKGDLNSSQVDREHNSQRFSWHTFHWRSGRKALDLTGPASMTPRIKPFPNVCLNKTWPEFIDHFVTRRSTFKTDMFLYPSLQSGDRFIVCGVVRERTSTKEYATVESEVYAGSIMNEIIALSSELDLPIKSCNSVRLIYPRVSMFDEVPVSEAEAKAVLPSPHSAVSAQQFEIIKECLDRLSPRKVLPYATADLGKKLIVLGFELGFTTLIVALGFNPPFVKSLLHGLMDAIR